MSRKRIGIGIIIAIVIMAAFWWWQSKQSKKTVETPYTIKRMTLEETLPLSGEIKAHEHVVLRFQSGGRLSWIGVKEGDHVKKYQAIASLDQRLLRKTLDKYLNTFVKERLDFEQDNSDLEDTAHLGLTQEIRDEAKRALAKSQYDLTNSVLDVELQDLSLQYATITSPIDGVVVRVDSPQAGINISLPTQAEFEIVNPASVYFSLLADQDEVTKLTASAAGSLVLDSYPEATMSGYIETIGFIPKQNESGTVYPVTFTFPTVNTDFRYRIGMTGDVTFVTNRKQDVLAVPTDYIQLDEENSTPFLFVKSNGKKQKKPITTGMETDEYTEITSGISESETVYD